MKIRSFNFHFSPILMSTTLHWTEKIKSNSRVLDPLGIFYHLKIQNDYVPAITSVTRRMRYYTLQAWFFQNKTENDNPHKLERLFILSTLHHHDGDSSHPSIRHIFNKQYFDKDWDSRDTFPLNSDFKISGFGRTYYVRQLERLRCAWHDGIKSHTTLINEKLASTITLHDNHLNQDEVKKSDLSQYSSLCICDSENNEDEIDVFSRVLFGFLKLDSPEDLEENIPEKYVDGSLDLSFLGIDGFSESTHYELTQRRRNTLFMFMKIIDSINPKTNQWRDTVMDAIYYKQNPLTKKQIDFGNLEKIQQYWEVHQYLIYYVYAMESVLDVLQKHLRKNVDGIQTSKLFSSLDVTKFYDALNTILDSKLGTNSLFSELISKIDEKINSDFALLTSSFHEQFLAKSLRQSQIPEEKMALTLVLLCLLRKRLEHLPQNILNHYSQSDFKEITDELNLHNVVDFFDNSGTDLISDFSQKLMEKVCGKHLFESSSRYRHGTKNWIFTEEEGVLYPSGRKLVKVDDRNNRWNPIYNLLLDTKMIENDSVVKLTRKGQTWMKMIN